MSNNLEIIKNKVDWMKIIQMTLKRKDWGKTYNLYVLNDVTIKSTMESFNFKFNKAIFEIKIDYPLEDYDNQYFNYTMIELYMDNYSLDDMERLIHKKIITLLKDVIRFRIKKLGQEEYSDLKYNIYDIGVDEIKKYRYEEDYNEINNISNDTFKEVAMSELYDMILLEMNREYENKIQSYINNEKQPKEELYQLLEQLEEEK